MTNTDLPPANAARLAWPMRLRFSLKWLLIAVTALCILLALSVLFGDFLGIMFFGVFFCVLPTPLVICALFGRGDVQAFAVGALVPWVTLIFWAASSSFVSLVLSLLILPAACGSIAVATRRFLTRFGAS